jgi:hypothetical protein
MTYRRPHRQSQRSNTPVRSQLVQPSTHNLTKLIERDAPLLPHTTLVLMYGPFQAEMASGEGQGVASWLKECVKQHGVPSLLRFDCRRCVQVFRRDEFQPWLEPLMAK